MFLSALCFGTETKKNGFLLLSGVYVGVIVLLFSSRGVRKAGRVVCFENMFSVGEKPWV